MADGTGGLAARWMVEWMGGMDAWQMWPSRRLNRAYPHRNRLVIVLASSSSVFRTQPMHNLSVSLARPHRQSKSQELQVKKKLVLRHNLIQLQNS